ncbi:MAG TPA: response regulator transcription factor [Acidimicrobiales bacterium]
MSNSSPSNISVAVVDDQILVAEMLAYAITKESDLHLAGVATNIADALVLIADERPDVVLIDYVLPDGDGIEAVKKMLRNSSATRFILLSSNHESELRELALDAGCARVLSKDRPIDEVLAAVRSTARGDASSLS